MPLATVTLSTVRLMRSTNAGESPVKFESQTGLNPGVRVFADAELMAILSYTGNFDGSGYWYNVRRGVDGTSSSDHSAGITCTIGNADQFYSTDPVGSPQSSVPVLPYINVLTGQYWTAEGDNGNQGLRWWARVYNQHAVTSFGNRTSTSVTSDLTDQ